MSDEPVLHPGHRSIRLKGFDYSTPSVYFVTICTHERRCVLGRVDRNLIEQTSIGRIAHESWIAIPSHFPQVNIYAFVVMPNHLHGIIEIASLAGAQRAAPLPEKIALKPHVGPGSLGAVVRSFKAAVTKRANRELGWRGEVWQRNYFERVLRDGKEFSDASRYIAENLLMWELDQENPNRRR